MAQVPLTYCPDCGYSLHTLPARYCCPECGFEYDELTRVWKPEKPRKAYIGSLGMLILLLRARAILRFVHYKTLQAIVLAGYVVFILVLVLYWSRVYFANRQGRFIAIGPRGISFRTVEREGLLAWDQFDDSREPIPPPGHERADLVRQMGDKVFKLLDHESILTSRAEADEFVFCLIDRIEQRRQAFTEEPTVPPAVTPAAHTP